MRWVFLFAFLVLQCDRVEQIHRHLHTLEEKCK